MSILYVYDGGFDGLLTAVFDAYTQRAWDCEITAEEQYQAGLDRQVVHVRTHEHKAARVERGIVTKIGGPVLEKIWTVFLADVHGKDTVIFHYLRRGFQIGRNLHNDLAFPDVLAFDKLHRVIGREAHLLKEFLRFSEMEGGVFYARVSPQHRVVPLLMPHFAERYCVQPFLIHDDVHQVAGLYDREEWWIADADGLTLPEISVDELAFRRMWKGFYNAIGIRGRANARCRQNMMPKKYWRNMTEFNFVDTPHTRRLDRRGALARPE